MEVEVAVIGSMLIDAETVAPTLARVAAEDFTTPAYREIFQAIQRIFQRQGRVDGVTVNTETHGTYHDILVGIMNVTPTAANYEEYIELLKEQATLYRLQVVGNHLAAARDANEARGLLEKANRMMVSRPGIQSWTMKEAYEDFFLRHDSETAPDYLRWGMDFLDSRVCAAPGDMVVLGGYPSDGKTALALMFAYRFAAAGKRVGYFTNEGSLDQIHDRIIAAQCLVDLPAIKRNQLTEDNYADIVAMQKRLISPALEITMAVDWTVFDIQSYAQARHCDIVFVDYLQNIPADHGSGRMTDFERVTRVSHDLQKFGRATGTTIVALSQLTRPEKRKDGTVPAPTMANLRQSGQIEQDANIIMLLYSEHPDEAESPRILKLEKNKEGERYKATRLAFDGKKQIFTVRSAYTPPPPKKRDPDQVTFRELTSKRTEQEIDSIFPPEGSAK